MQGCFAIRACGPRNVYLRKGSPILRYRAGNRIPVPSTAFYGWLRNPLSSTQCDLNLGIWRKLEQSNMMSCFSTVRVWGRRDHPMYCALMHSKFGRTAPICQCYAFMQSCVAEEAHFHSHGMSSWDLSRFADLKLLDFTSSNVLSSPRSIRSMGVEEWLDVVSRSFRLPLCMYSIIPYEVVM
jgi:hypothetical protein